MPPTRRSLRAVPAGDRARSEASTSAARLTLDMPTPSRARRAAHAPGARRLAVRQSLASGVQVQEMTLEQRANTLLTCAGDCLSRLVKAAVSGDQDDVDAARRTWDTLQHFRHTYLLPTHSPPFPDVDAVIDTLHPSLSSDLQPGLLESALSRSSFVTFLHVIANPDDSGELYLELDEDGQGAPRRGKGRANADLQGRVRRRNRVLEMTWKKFWEVVVPADKRGSESALRLWLDFATQLFLLYQCPTVDPSSSPDLSLPAISQLEADNLFSASATDRLGVWDDDGLAEKRDVEARWVKLARQRSRMLRARNANIDDLTAQMPWSKFRDELFAWVEVEVLNSIDDEDDAPSSVRSSLESEQHAADAAERSFASRADADAADDDLLELMSSPSPSPRKVQPLPTPRRRADDFDDDIDLDLLNDIAAEMQNATPPRRSTERGAGSQAWALRTGSAAPLVRPSQPRKFAFGERQDDAVRVDWETQQTQQTPARARPSEAVRRERTQDPPSVPRAERQSLAAPSSLTKPSPSRLAAASHSVERRDERPSRVEIAGANGNGSDDDDEDDDIMPETYHITGAKPTVQPRNGPSPHPAASAPQDEDEEEDYMPETDQFALPQPQARNSALAVVDDEDDIMPETYQFASPKPPVHGDLADDATPGTFEIAGQNAPRLHQREDSLRLETRRVARRDPALDAVRNGPDEIDEEEAEEIEELEEDRQAQEPYAELDNVFSPDYQPDYQPQAAAGDNDGPASRDVELVPRVSRKRQRSGTFASPDSSDDEREAHIRARMERVPSRPAVAVAGTATPSPSPPQARVLGPAVAVAGTATPSPSPSRARVSGPAVAVAGTVIPSPSPSRARVSSPAVAVVDAPRRTPSPPRVRRGRAALEHGEVDPYLVDEDGLRLEFDEELVLPLGYEPERSFLHHQKAGQTSVYSRRMGKTKWPASAALLLYRTVQQVPLSEGYPLRVAWYLYGEFGVRSTDLALWNPQHMKDKMRTIVNTRTTNGRPVEGRARFFLPTDDERKLACEREETAWRKAYADMKRAEEQERLRREAEKQAAEAERKAAEAKRKRAERKAEKQARLEAEWDEEEEEDEEEDGEEEQDEQQQEEGQAREEVELDPTDSEDGSAYGEDDAPGRSAPASKRRHGLSGKNELRTGRRPARRKAAPAPSQAGKAPTRAARKTALPEGQPAPSRARPAPSQAPPAGRKRVYVALPGRPAAQRRVRANDDEEDDAGAGEEEGDDAGDGDEGEGEGGEADGEDAGEGAHDDDDGDGHDDDDGEGDDDDDEESRAASGVNGRASGPHGHADAAAAEVADEADVNGLLADGVAATADGAEEADGADGVDGANEPDDAAPSGAVDGGEGGADVAEDEDAAARHARIRQQVLLGR